MRELHALEGAAGRLAMLRKCMGVADAANLHI